MHRIIALQLFVLSFFCTSLYSQSQDINCYTIIVGKNATFDGSVLLAHNEDDYGKNLVNWYKVPHLQQYQENIKLFTGGLVDQVQETLEFLWLEMPGMHFSDSFMNEYGVTIVSDACRSREDNADLINGGIGYYLRRIIAERAKSAKHGVKIAGAIVDSIGYASSGRTYCIADPNEAWMMSIVKGKHWVAQRVPDDHIAIIPNYYTIGEIDLLDTLNYLGSHDIVEYAIERSWYNPITDGEFIFRNAYGDSATQSNIRNIARHWGAINLLVPDQYELNDDFPFSFRPNDTISIQDIMDILEYHYEGTELEDKTFASPHDYKTIPICRKDTQYGMIAQLRDWLPADIGNVLWLAPYRPCSQVFIPWYYGISKIPSNFSVGDHKSALENHFNKERINESNGHLFWEYVTFSDNIDDNYYKLIESLTKKKDSTQLEIFNNFDEFDSNIEYRYKNNPNRTISNIDFFMKDMIQISLDYLQ